MPLHDNLKPARIQGPGFDELEKAGLVLCASGLQGDGGQMLGGEYASGLSIHVPFDRFGQGFLDQGRP